MERQLEERRSQLEYMQRAIQREFEDSETESTQALSAYDNHPADLGTETFHRELNAGINLGLNQQLHRVQRAQQKIDEGTYGACDRCGRPIGESRLSAVAEAIFCLSCEEAAAQSYQPPLSKDEVGPVSFGDRRDIHRDVVEPDGEELSQAVAQFGTSDSPQDTPPAVDYFETFVGFEESVGIAEDVEAIVDENGEVLFDALRERPRQVAKTTDAETGQPPE
jgi:RNA polymerase-binding transcription factor DksA